MEGDGSFSASGRTLNDKDTVFCIADDGILLLLDGADDIFKLYVAVAAKLFF